MFGSSNLRRGISHSQCYTDCVTSVAFSPNGQYLATGNSDKTARVWDLDKGTQIACLQVRSILSCMMYRSYVHRNIVHKYFCVRRSSPEDCGPSHLQGHTDRVTSVAFSPNGQYLATRSWDTTARVWDLDCCG